MQTNNLIQTKKENAGVSGMVRIIKTRAGTQDIISDVVYKNLVMNGTNTGVNLLAQRLGAVNTYSGNITHGAIGTGNTTPADSDTALVAQVAQVAATLLTVTGNVITAKFFFPDGALANGTYYEFGTKIDTTQLFNRVLFGSAYVKATGEDTTVEAVFTLSNA